MPQVVISFIFTSSSWENTWRERGGNISSLRVGFFKRVLKRNVIMARKAEVGDFLHDMRQPRQSKTQHRPVQGSSSSVRNFWNSLNAMYNFAVKSRMFPTNPFRGQ